MHHALHTIDYLNGQHDQAEGLVLPPADPERRDDYEQGREDARTQTAGLFGGIQPPLTWEQRTFWRE